MASVALRGLNKTFLDAQSGKNVAAVDNLNLEIRDGEFLVLVGPSGCGKSTALRMIAGLEDISGGEIFIGDNLVNDAPPRDRNIAMVFQNYALYPHMSVYENMAFGLKLRRLPGFFGRLAGGAETKRIQTEIDDQIKDAAEVLGITHLLNRKPKALSGGQRQRVALGRAIVRHPEVFLMDEPLSNLDAKLRVQTRAELIKLHRKLGVTTIYVTHDQVEAMTMGQRIAVMKDGVLQQCATPLELYHHPVNMFVAGFIGTPSMNFLPGKLSMQNGPTVDIGFPLSLDAARAATLQTHNGKDVIFGIRPEDIHDKNLVPVSAQKATNIVPMMVEVVEPMGSKTVVYLRSGENSLVAEMDAETQAKEGQTLEVVLDTAGAHLFDKETENVIA
ncbi:carbohydrate ABC transporter ATP-binding protein, CUT1 family [Abditibacterium utsteinense]|uniref:Carbohydrate ABC transporter ATP-binding protein, CUT1 family n=1 Tax=Abditibacterium utsteinense TaxID=1960156 RepID=A0A2S8SQP7_9BACT|nr:sn-glycerol-3-phosphate ABC transporter ATP-binding protein UgpC [Abditibacterium utsteinense]PQV63069.1 carbohydrate ABC transporter ATP-binding protein, CUT1 family [Abditibacterium utsteinense]